MKFPFAFCLWFAFIHILCYNLLCICAARHIWIIFVCELDRYFSSAYGPVFKPNYKKHCSRSIWSIWNNKNLIYICIFLKLHSYSLTKHIIFQEYYQRDCATWSFLLVQDLIIPDGKTICIYFVFDNCYFHFPLCINPCLLSIYQYPLLLTKNYNYKISLSLSYIWFFLVNILQWLF